MDSRVDGGRRRRRSRRTSSRVWSRPRRSRTSSTGHRTARTRRSSGIARTWSTRCRRRGTRCWPSPSGSGTRGSSRSRRTATRASRSSSTCWSSRLGRRSSMRRGEQLVLEQEPTERALEVMGRVREFADGSSARRRHLGRGLGRPRLRGRQLRVHAQLHVRVRKRERERPGYREEHGRGAAARGRRGPTLRASARRLQPRDQRRSPRIPDLAFEAATCLVNEESALTTTELDGLPPARENIYTTTPSSARRIPTSRNRSRQSIENAAPRPQDARLHGSLARDPADAPPDQQHRPERRRGDLRRASQRPRGRVQQGGAPVRRSEAKPSPAVVEAADS